MQAEQVKPTHRWIYTFLTHYDVPVEVAKSCEEKLLEQGFYSPQVLAVTKPSKFQSDFLDSIGVVSPGVQHLLIALQAELHADRIKDGKPLWTAKMEEAVAEDKKRARDETEGAKWVLLYQSFGLRQSGIFHRRNLLFLFRKLF